MKEIAMGVHGVKGVHAIRLRKSGPVSFGEMHIEMEVNLPLDKAHAISNEVEEKIRKRFQDVESITIHIGISHKEKIRISIPVLEDKGLESMASPHFGGAKLFAFVDTEKGQITSFLAKINKAANLTRKKGIVAAQILVDENVDVVLVSGLGEGPFHRLRENMVQIYYLKEPVNVEEAVRLLSQNKLERMMSPIDVDESKNAE
jgi:predicted Fe-Mo cluster-binding NifX family protein